MNRYAFATAAFLVSAALAGWAQPTYRVLHHFALGDNPIGSGVISQGRDGNLFSASGDAGGAFRISPDGGFVPMHSFSGRDGQFPAGGLTLGSNGWLYGTTVYYGENEGGTIFKMRYTGAVTILHSFDFTNGANPFAPPVQGLAGDFYGTARGDFHFYSISSLYRISNTGVFTLLHAMWYWPDGGHVSGPLVQATNYWFYGTAYDGGAHDLGTIFRVNQNGNFESLFHFDGVHGAHPMAGLIQGQNGNFYGVTESGGAYGRGAVFEMTPNHTVHVLYSFTGGATDGAQPDGGLVQANDGNLYGTTSIGGAYQGGVLFRLTPDGSLTALHRFTDTTGRIPLTALMQHTNGRLYGMTCFGGHNNGGVFFSFDAGLPPFVTYLPVYGRVGAVVEILGQGFTPESVVSFNSVPADSTTWYSTFIKAVVPAGATTGFITVTTGDVTLQSNKAFIVRP